MQGQPNQAGERRRAAGAPRRRAFSSSEGSRQPPQRRSIHGMPGIRISQPEQDPRYTSPRASGAISLHVSYAR